MSFIYQITQIANHFLNVLPSKIGFSQNAQLCKVLMIYLWKYIHLIYASHINYNWHIDYVFIHYIMTYRRTHPTRKCYSSNPDIINTNFEIVNQGIYESQQYVEF